MIAIIAGTRPELIKVAPLYLEFKKRGAPVQVWLTGQHESLAEAPLEFFGIQPAQHWKTLQAGQSSNVLLSKLLTFVDQAMAEVRPEAIVVQGDTTSALAGALAGFHRGVPVAHVEAGLRTGDLSQPFPEEMNRKVIDAFAHWLFPPTELSRKNLLREGAVGIDPPTGNTGIDALFWARDKINRQGYWPDHIPHHGLYGSNSQVVLSTGHRRENLGEPLFQVLRTLAQVIEEDGNTVLYHVVHPNPLATQIASEALQGKKRVHLIPALDYPDFVCLLDQADIVVSDSGGVQEEAPSFAVKVLITRNVTERPEVLECGGELVGTDPSVIRERLKQALKNPRKKGNSNNVTPFGDGNASSRIASRILNDLPGFYDAKKRVKKCGI